VLFSKLVDPHAVLRNNMRAERTSAAVQQTASRWESINYEGASAV
jgi:hypothetical protein